MGEKKKLIMEMYLANKSIGEIAITLNMQVSKIEDIIRDDEYAQASHKEAIKKNKEKSNG